MQDIKYRDFHSRLIPTVDKSLLIGVRTPKLRAYAKELLKSGEAESFLQELPHKYYDENQLHAFLLSEIKDFETALCEVENFLPYVDNWATCDQLRPKGFKKNRERLLSAIDIWLVSDKTYTIRFGIGMLMTHFLDDGFDESMLARVGSVKSEEYYVNMMLAWYFATALAKQYDSAVTCLEEHRLDVWVHNKTIQKARESYRISPEQKEYLKTLKR